MRRAVLDGLTLEYECVGAGDPIVLIHGALIADAFRPLLAESALTNEHQLLLYHRRGYAGSTHAAGAISVAQHAADCRALLKHLGIGRAHIGGHSYGGAVALQLALDSPELIESLALLEPAVFGGQAYLDVLSKGQERHRREGAEVVIDDFLKQRFGPEYRPQLDGVLPGSFAQAIADADTWFEQEVPGLQAWTFDAHDAQRITQPVLALLGGESDKTMAPLWRDAAAAPVVVALCQGCRACRREPRDAHPRSRCGRRGTCHVLPAPSDLPLGLR